MLRRSGVATRPTEVRTTANVVQLTPMPTSRPMPITSRKPVEAFAASARPAAKRQRAEADNGRRAVAVGGGAGKGLRESPDQVVQGDRNGDGAQR